MKVYVVTEIDFYGVNRNVWNVYERKEDAEKAVEALQPWTENTLEIEECPLIASSV